MSYTSFDNVGLVKVLSFFQTHDSEYLSGQDLSDVLKISRVAVWKHIKKIKTLGYKIESKQKLGYRLVDDTEKLLPWEITTNLKTKVIGKRVHYFEEIDSKKHEIIFIKIDVEGHELEVLQGAAKIISNKKSLLLVEVEKRHNKKYLEVFKYLIDLGFSIYHVKESRLQPVVFEKVENIMLAANNFVFKNY